MIPRRRCRTSGVGCTDFLKTNHEPQDLAAVNFRGKRDDDESEAGEEDIAEDATANAPARWLPRRLRLNRLRIVPPRQHRLRVVRPPRGRESSVQDNEVWGWTLSPTRRELALMDLASGTASAKVTESRGKGGDAPRGLVLEPRANSRSWALRGAYGIP